MKSRAAAIVIGSLAAAGVCAQETKPAPQAPPVVAGANATPVQAPSSALSQSKFLGLLYAEIARRTPPQNPAGKGEVSASFHVNALGKVDKVVIDKSTSPAHAELVKKILAAVQAPSPPGGGTDISQSFKFH
jgi:outer membrane biosynthesis protein TonB